MIQDVQSAMAAYAQVHQGGIAANWSQVLEQLEPARLNVGEQGANPAFPLPEKYVFVREALPMPTAWKGDVVLMRIEPMDHPTSGLGRYVISHHAKGFVYSWLPEEDVQKMLTDSGVKLPEPEQFGKKSQPASSRPDSGNLERAMARGAEASWSGAHEGQAAAAANDPSAAATSAPSSSATASGAGQLAEASPMPTLLRGLGAVLLAGCGVILLAILLRARQRSRSMRR